MLKNKSLSLTEIALACRFSDQSHFTKVFHHQVSNSPLITAGIATAAVSPGLTGGEPSGPAGDAEPTLSALAPTDISTAFPTLDPATSKAAVDDAKSCKAPLATLVKRPGSRGGLVRINSGPYLLPPFQLTNSPQRIAIPYAAPYPTGRGVLSLVGDAFL